MKSITRVGGAKAATRPLTLLGALALLAGLIMASAPAEAAQIDLTNCQPKEVRVCAWDDDQVGWELQGHHIYSKVGETYHFTCRANCKFSIVNDCKNGHCTQCQGAGSAEAWVDHSWGKGTYQLVDLKKNSDGNYKSADLQKVDAGAQCP